MSDLAGKVVALFGGGGFIGRYAAQNLSAAQARLRIVQRDPRKATFLRPLGNLGWMQFVAADLSRPESVDRAMDGVDMAVNLVGVFGDAMHRIHVDGARNFAEAAARAGVRAVVHLSAIGADPASPSAYGRSKGLGEQAVRDAFPAATILRPSVVFGREDQFINRFAGMVRMMPVIPVIAPGTRLQPVFVGDVARAITAALADPVAHGGRTYDLGGPQAFTMAELFAWIASQTGRRRMQLPVPDTAAAMLSKLPGGPLSHDQWLMLQRDNVVAEGAAGLKQLGIDATPIDAVAEGWLSLYRRHGRFAQRAGRAD